MQPRGSPRTQGDGARSPAPTLARVELGGSAALATPAAVASRWPTMKRSMAKSQISEKPPLYGESAIPPPVGETAHMSTTLLPICFPGAKLGSKTKG